MKLCTALLLDTVSIQSYIFSSNRLRENLGASHLVKSIYLEHINKTLKELWPEEYDMESWRDRSAGSSLAGKRVEAGFIGGGKALLLFRDEKDARLFLRTWSRDLLVTAPGLSTAVALDPGFRPDDKWFSRDLERLFARLAANKNRHMPVTTVAASGITSICPWTGFTVEGAVPKGVAGPVEIPVSSVSLARVKAAEEEETQLNRDFAALLGQEFAFTRVLDKLGQKKDEDSHIAIVHADANGMGERFRECRTLGEYRGLALQVESQTRLAFGRLLEHVCTQVLPYMKRNSEAFALAERDKRTILPIRPLILGGDDVTFVCEGRLGVYLAGKMLEYWEESSIDTPGAGSQPIHACAGIALVKSKYPFYRAYQWAEELCSLAKRQARQTPGSSWLDFYIHYGANSGDVESIRASQLSLADYSLCFGPYRVCGTGGDPDHDYGHLKSGMAWMATPPEAGGWPRNKLKEFRSRLYEGRPNIDLFAQDIDARGLKVPGQDRYADPRYARNLYADRQSPYHDILELMEYYPVELIAGGETHR